MRHGTRYGWTRGCRCDECEEARRVEDRARRQRRKDRAKADPTTIQHGKWGYAEYGCRCEVCTASHRQQHRDRLGSQPAKTWTEEQIGLAMRLYATVGSKAAAEAVDANQGTIRKWARARGVECYAPPPAHGRYRYDRHGCRCDVCVAAYRRDTSQGKAWRLAHQDQAPHGTETGYMNWGCRCDDCKDAGSISNARALRKRKARQVLERVGS